MWPRYLAITAAFFLLMVLQASFFSHLAVLGFTVHLVVIGFFTLIFFQRRGSYYQGFFEAVTAGFIMDLFSPYYFGLSMVLMVAIYFITRAVLHFLNDPRDSFSPLYFILLFCLNFLLYVLAIDWIFQHHVNLADTLFWVGFLVNVLVAILCFVGYVVIEGLVLRNKQLTLW